MRSSEGCGIREEGEATSLVNSRGTLMEHTCEWSRPERKHKKSKVPTLGRKYQLPRSNTSHYLCRQSQPKTGQFLFHTAGIQVHVHVHRQRWSYPFPSHLIMSLVPMFHRQFLDTNASKKPAGYKGLCMAIG